MHIDQDPIAALTHRHWVIPVLAELYRDDGAKFVTLQRRLSLTQAGLRQTLDYCIDRGWVMRNPGTGHPMRPEYILCPSARQLGSDMVGLWDLCRRLDGGRLTMRKWSLPILSGLGVRSARFGEIRNLLPGVSDRALSETLKLLIQEGWVRFDVVNQHPPTGYYRASGPGLALADAISELDLSTLQSLKPGATSNERLNDRSF